MEDALVFVTDTFVRARDAGQITGAVLVDMSKAFDKVRHQVLINDLFELGISGSALVWFADYLSNRRQIVHIAENYSPPFPCMCGVPQGSVVRRNYWSVGDTHFSQKFAFHLLGEYACTRVSS